MHVSIMYPTCKEKPEVVLQRKCFCFAYSQRQLSVSRIKISFSTKKKMQTILYIWNKVELVEYVYKTCINIPKSKHQLFSRKGQAIILIWTWFSRSSVICCVSFEFSLLLYITTYQHINTSNRVLLDFRLSLIY